MFEYRHALVRLRAGDTVREIARNGLMGRDRLGALRALAHFQAVDFHQPFDDEGRLRAPGASIRVDRRGVGVDAVDFRIDGGNVVLARQQRRIKISRHAARKGRQQGSRWRGH